MTSVAPYIIIKSPVSIQTNPLDNMRISIKSTQILIPIRCQIESHSAKFNTLIIPFIIIYPIALNKLCNIKLSNNIYICVGFTSPITKFRYHDCTTRLSSYLAHHWLLTNPPLPNINKSYHIGWYKIFPFESNRMNRSLVYFYSCNKQCSPHNFNLYVYFSESLFDVSLLLTTMWGHGE